MSRLHYYHTEHLMKPHVHGEHDKFMAILHETITPDMPGLADIESVEKGLAARDYGIHGMNDRDGNMAWAYGLGRAIFYHAGGVNAESIGIEQVSMIPSLIQNKILTNEQAHKHWLARTKQLHATAIQLSAWHNTDPHKHVLTRSNGITSGVCSHWDVSQHHPESQGHWDCRPVDRGGHYPLWLVIHLAQSYVHFGYKF